MGIKEIEREKHGFGIGGEEGIAEWWIGAAFWGV